LRQVQAFGRQTEVARVGNGEDGSQLAECDSHS
jgi:hypothetical protein